MQGRNWKTYFATVIIAAFITAKDTHAAFEEDAGARPFGMAGVFTAIADDCNAISWNAAGLTRVKKMSIELMFSKPFLGVDYDNIYSGYASLAIPLGGFGTAGAGYQLFKSDTYSENTIMFSAGINILQDFLSLGVTGKLLSLSYTQNDYTNIDPLFSAFGYSKSGYAADASLLLSFGKSAALGVVVENLVSSNSFALGTLEYKLPPAYRCGFALYLGDFVPGVELSYRSKDMENNYALDIAGGFEWWTEDRTFAFRAGGSAKEATAGLTYIFGDVGINYGFSYPMQGLSGTFGSHRISMNIEFGRVLPSQKDTRIGRMKIAVMDLLSQNADPGVAMVITDLLRNDLFNTGKYSVLERSNMDKLIKEQQFQWTGCTTTECAVELGKILNMQEMVVGSVNKLGTKTFISVRMVDVESGEITRTALVECYSDNDLSDACKEITGKLVKIKAGSGREVPLTKEEEAREPNKARVHIGIMDMTSQNMDQSIALILTDLLRNNLFNSEKYSVLERENMDKIIKEQKFQSTGCTTTECAVELGKLLNVQEMVVSSVNKIGSKYLINARIVDVKTGEIVVTSTDESYSDNDLSEACKKITNKLIEGRNKK